MTKSGRSGHDILIFDADFDVDFGICQHIMRCFRLVASKKNKQK